MYPFNLGSSVKWSSPPTHLATLAHDLTPALPLRFGRVIDVNLFPITAAGYLVLLNKLLTVQFIKNI